MNTMIEPNKLAHFSAVRVSCLCSYWLFSIVRASNEAENPTKMLIQVAKLVLRFGDVLKCWATFSFWCDDVSTWCLLPNVKRFHLLKEKTITQPGEMRNGIVVVVRCELLSRDFYEIIRLGGDNRNSGNLFMWCWVVETGSSYEHTHTHQWQTNAEQKKNNK